jgi:hypothetical protein
LSQRALHKRIRSGDRRVPDGLECQQKLGREEVLGHRVERDVARQMHKAMSFQAVEDRRALLVSIQHDDALYAVQPGHRDLSHLLHSLARIRRQGLQRGAGRETSERPI